MTEPFDLYVEGNGTSLLLSKKGEGRYGHRPGSTGFGMIPRSTRIREGSSSGGSFLGVRVKTRPLLLKVSILGSLADQREGLDILREAFTATDSRLVVIRDGVSWVLPVVYESGLEGDLSRSSADTKFTLADVALTAPQPYWLLSASTVVEARVSDDTRVFLDDLSGLPLSDSLAISDSVVSNPGDAETPVVWLLRGPCESAEVSIGGRGFSVPAGLADGEELTVDPTVSGMPAVADQDGGSAYARLAMGPMFPKLPRGESTVHLKMDGAKAGVRVTGDQILATNWLSNPALRANRAGWSVDDEGLWTYTAGSPGRLDCRSDMNDRPFLMPNWLYNAKQEFASDAWYPDLRVTFTKGVATLVMAHTARKVCSVRALDATLKWDNPYAAVVGTEYKVAQYVSDGDKTFTITLEDATVSGDLLVVATDEGGEVIHKGQAFEAWPMWRPLDDGEIACAIDSIWWAWDDFALLKDLDGGNPLWGRMLDHFRAVVPSLVDVNDFHDWLSTNAGTDDPLDLDGAYWVDERTPAAAITRSRSTGAVDITVPQGEGHVQYGRFNVNGQWAADSTLSVQVSSSTPGYMLLLVDPTGDYDPKTRYTALVALDGTGGVQNLELRRSDFVYVDKLVWHHALLGSWYGIYKDSASVATDVESDDRLGVTVSYQVASWAQMVLSSDKAFTTFPTIRYSSSGGQATLRVKDADGWYWYHPLDASDTVVDASPGMEDFTTNGDQANTGTPPVSFTGTFTEIAVTFAGSGVFTLYGVGDFVSPPVGASVGNIGLYYDRAPALDLSVYYLRMLPVQRLQYSPWVVPYTVNVLNGRVNTYRGIPFTGYQAPWFWQELNKPEGVDTVLGFLRDAQDAYERIHGFRGPFASAYVWDRQGSSTYGDVGTWYEDPWGGYQYRTIDVVCKALKNDPTLTVAARIATDFIDWIYAVWPSADTAPPDLFNKGVDPVTAGEGPHSVGILMRAMIFAQQSGVFDDDDRVVTLIDRCARFLARTYVADQSLDVYGTWSTEPEKETWWQFWNGEILYALAQALEWYRTDHGVPDYTDSIMAWLQGNLQYLTAHRRSGLPNAMNEEYLAGGTFESGDKALDWTRWIPWQSGVSETQTILLRGVLDVARVTGSSDWLDLGLGMSEAMMQTLFDLRRTATWSMSKPTTGWPASVISCSIATDSQLMVEFLDADGALISRHRTQSVMDRAGVQNLAIPEGAETIRLGSQGVSPQGVTQGLLVFGSSATGYFDGDSQYAAWQGDADASPSDLHASELQGGSLIRMSYHQRKEIMR